MMKKSVLYLSAPLLDFFHGQFLGVDLLSNLKQNGDFGLGTFDYLDGEMIVKDGIVYQVKDDGKVYIPLDTEKAPYSQIVFFNSETTLKINKKLNNNNLNFFFDEHLPSLKHNYAIKVTGKFNQMEVRSVKKQTPPFTSIAEAIKSQSIFELGSIEGTLIGFRLSDDFLKGTDWNNYHHHFLSENKQQGGHVLSLQIISRIAEIMKLDQVKIGCGCRR
jgi:acetolactate decarboxylase